MNAISKIRQAIVPGTVFYLLVAPVSTLVNSTTAPLLPLLGDHFQVGAQALGLLSSIGGIGMVLVDLPVGNLIPRIGTRRMLVLALLPVALGPILCASAQSFWQLLLGKALSGIGFAMLLSINISAFAGAAPPKSMGSKMGALSTVQLCGTAIGPLLSGSVARIGGWRAPFVIMACLAILTVVLVLVKYNSIVDVRDARDSTTLRREYPRQQRDPVARKIRNLFPKAMLLVSYLYFVSVFSRSGTLNFLLPLIGRDEARLSVETIGGLLSLAALLTIAVTLPVGALADRLGTRRVLFVGLLLLLLAEGMMLISSTPFTLFVVATIFGLAGPTSSLTYALYGILSRKNASVNSLGSFRIFGDLGASTGALSLGLLLAVLDYRAALFGVFCVGALALVLLGLDIRREVTLESVSEAD